MSTSKWIILFIIFIVLVFILVIVLVDANNGWQWFGSGHFGLLDTVTADTNAISLDIAK